METDRLITVAIHTLDKASELKALLEREGVEATLQNVNLANPVMSAGVRVRIAEGDLPLALRIIENPEIFVLDADGKTSAGGAHTLLVPVDFTDKSVNAVKVAFNLAAGNGDKVVMLHSFLVPHSNPLMSMGDSLNIDAENSEAEEVEISVAMAKSARAGMQKLEQHLRAEIKRGELPAVRFSTVINEGLPEECISRYIKENSADVRMLVMGTRAAEKKSGDMAGSVTAEVLDSCRVQALTVPEHGVNPLLIKNLRQIAILSHLEQEDFLAFDALYRLLPEGMAIDVKVICLPNDRYSQATNEAARRALQLYCAEHFPGFRCELTEHDKSRRDLEVDSADLVVVPSRKKSIFARLFNPGAAHRLLFHCDVPLLVIPV